MKKVAVIVGSLRKDSFNLKIAETLIEMAPQHLSFQLIEIGHLPLYNQDLDSQPPMEWTALRQQIKPMDAVLFVTPEYNRSLPGVLKNAIDIASRPYGKNVFDKKPAAIVSVTVGSQGAFGANHHLRQILAYLNMPTLAQPEAYIGKVEELFDAQGKIKNDKTKDFLKKFIQAFDQWIQTMTHKGSVYEKEAQP